ncbi:MAG: hypothetical protein U5Q03_19225 [Bacteroidota bacterium]|nr:hypothetical protein [Bacteroidota bacterium]
MHNYIEKADETFLRMVYAMSEEYTRSKIVGYKTDGNPITKKELAIRAGYASKRVKSDEYISQEEIEKEYGI